MIFLKRADDAMWCAGVDAAGRRKHYSPGRGAVARSGNCFQIPYGGIGSIA